MNILAILSGLAAAMSWGAGDFSGGLASRREAPVRVLLASQFIGTIILLFLGLLLRQPRPPSSALITGGIAGLAGGVGLLLLYLSLARGKMGVAAPLTAVASGGIPLLVGLATEGLPGVAQIAGFLLALAAIWIISRPDKPQRSSETSEVWREVALPLLAGVGFGIFLAIIGRIDEETGFVWPLVSARVASMSFMVCLLLVGITGRGRAMDEQAVVAVDSRSFPWMLAAIAGVGDTMGNALFVYSSQVGRLDVAAVLGALYPAATVLLARVILAERLTRNQNLGVGLALVAVVLIAL